MPRIVCHFMLLYFIFLFEKSKVLKIYIFILWTDTLINFFLKVTTYLLIYYLFKNYKIISILFKIVT